MTGRLAYEWPDTNHPAYDGMADTVRRIMMDGRTQLCIPRLAPLWSFNEMEEYPHPLEVQTLRVNRAWGRAPYVGRPFVYMWDVAVDDWGRWDRRARQDRVRARPVVDTTAVVL